MLRTINFAGVAFALAGCQAILDLDGPTRRVLVGRAGTDAETGVWMPRDAAPPQSDHRDAGPAPPDGQTVEDIGLPGDASPLVDLGELRDAAALNDIGADADRDASVCDEIPGAPTVGEACAAAVECGAGATCRVAELGGDGACHQLCSPDLCVERCLPGEHCVALRRSDSGALDRLAGGALLGFCATPQEGSGAEYQVCDAGATCHGDLPCILHAPDAARGFCSPSCAGAEALCPHLDGAQPECLVQVTPDGAPDHCVLVCDRDEIGGRGSCPEAFTCIDMGHPGAGFCVP